ncbi:MAG: hypothetical protein HUJ65_02020 [Oscillospiraceae bacterium]|nr:hypothetical protein [Oscillospiraceae bacterium]
MDLSKLCNVYNGAAKNGGSDTKRESDIEEARKQRIEDARKRIAERTTLADARKRIADSKRESRIEDARKRVAERRRRKLIDSRIRLRKLKDELERSESAEELKVIAQEALSEIPAADVLDAVVDVMESVAEKLKEENPEDGDSTPKVEVEDGRKKEK